MALNKIILYYGFAPVADPKAVMLWQKTLCASLNLKGRILISEHGINGTLGGDMEDLKKYCRATKEYPASERSTSNGLMGPAMIFQDSASRLARNWWHSPLQMKLRWQSPASSTAANT
jgi:predicted sulfurtransferase